MLGIDIKIIPNVISSTYYIPLLVKALSYIIYARMFTLTLNSCRLFNSMRSTNGRHTLSNLRESSFLAGRSGYRILGILLHGSGSRME